MKKTINVNIGGFVFHLDEDAYDKTQQYLDTLKNYFHTSDGQDEIMQDVQTRIAEIFKERLGDHRQVISMADVEHMIGIMGKPEDYLEGDMAEGVSPEEPVSKGPKRLYRDPDNKVMGGVCGGLGAYFGIDPVIFRVVFALALILYGSGVLMYMVLWIAMPKARTTSEKLQMKGSKVDISSIEKSVKEELSGLKKNEATTKIGRAIRLLLNAIAQVILVILKYIGKTIGIIFMFFSLFMLILLIRGVFFNSNVNFSDGDLHVFMTGREAMGLLFTEHSDVTASLIGLSLFLFVPLVMLFYNGVRIIFKIKHRPKVLKIVPGVLWGIGMVICIYMGIKLIEQFKHKEHVSTTENISIQPGQTLYLRSTKSGRDSLIMKNFGKDQLGKIIMVEEVHFEILRNENDSLVKLQITRFARGKSWEEAGVNARKIIYSVRQTDTTLIFSPDVFMSLDDHFRNQEVRMTLFLPDNQQVYLDKSINQMELNIENLHHMWSSKTLGKTWVMKKEGLSCVTCTQAELDKAQSEYSKFMGDDEEDEDENDTIN